MGWPAQQPGDPGGPDLTVALGLLELFLPVSLISVQRGQYHTCQNSAQYFLSTFSGPHAVHSPLLMDLKALGANPLNSPVINPFHR